MWFHWHLNHHLLIRWCTSQPQHFIASASQSFPIGQWFLIASFSFGNFRPSAGRALSGILMTYSIRSCMFNAQKGNAGRAGRLLSHSFFSFWKVRPCCVSLNFRYMHGEHKKTPIRWLIYAPLLTHPIFWWFIPMSDAWSTFSGTYSRSCSIHKFDSQIGQITTFGATNIQKTCGGFLKWRYLSSILAKCWIINHFSKILTYKPSILGIPHLWKTLHVSFSQQKAPAEPRGVDADDLPALVGTQPRKPHHV